jgi:hypothetical protein
MKAQRQIIQEEEATGLQREDILYLSGRRMVDEKKLSQKLFGVDFFDLTCSQAEQIHSPMWATLIPALAVIRHSHVSVSAMRIQNGENASPVEKESH